MGGRFQTTTSSKPSLNGFSCTAGDNVGAFGRRCSHRVCKLEMVSVFTIYFLSSLSSLTVAGFYINLPAGAFVAIFLFFVRIPSHSNKTSENNNFIAIMKNLDIVGFVLFAPAAIMFLLALEWGGNVYNWDSATVIGLFCGSFGTIIIFFIWESRLGDEAMIPLSMITRRIIATSCLAMLFSAACMITTSFYMAIYFQADKGKSPMLSGVYLLPSILTQIVFGLFAGGLGWFSHPEF